MKAILTYHSIDDSGSVISTSPDIFAQHVVWLASGTVRPVSVPDLLAAPATADAIAVTFDDGFANLATDAWPHLAEHGIPATVFVPTALVGGTNAWDGDGRHGIPSMPLMDWDGLGRLAADGLAIEPHGRTHTDLRTVSGGRLAEEIEGACADLTSQLGIRARGFAYPYGGYDDRARTAAATMIDWACTTGFDIVAEGYDPHLLPRLDTFYFRRPGTLERWGSARFRMRLAAIAAARSVRRTLGAHRTAR